MKYLGYMAVTIIISLIVTNFVMKFMPENNIFIDFGVYCISAILCTSILAVLNSGFREFIKFW